MYSKRRDLLLRTWVLVVVSEYLDTSRVTRVLAGTRRVSEFSGYHLDTCVYPGISRITRVLWYPVISSVTRIPDLEHYLDTRVPENTRMVAVSSGNLGPIVDDETNLCIAH